MNMAFIFQRRASARASARMLSLRFWPAVEDVARHLPFAPPSPRKRWRNSPIRFVVVDISFSGVISDCSWIFSTVSSNTKCGLDICRNFQGESIGKEDLVQ